MADLFRLPPDGSIYADRIFTRCRDLIGYEFWSGIKPSRLDAWITNFKSAEERYFAARVLDALIYRSDDQTIAMLRELLGRVVPNYARVHGLPRSLQGIYTKLRNSDIDPGVRIVPVIPPDSSPTKSGTVIARQLKRKLRINENWILHPHEIHGELDDVDAVIFVDDFLGTGTQFDEFLTDTNLSSYTGSTKFVYGCLAGHESGINLLRVGFPSVHVVAVEPLDESHAIFHSGGGSFPDEVNSGECARDFYYELIADRGIDIDGPDRRGFGHLELTYAFEHAVPDNSLPILWWNRSDQWRPLFDR